MFYVCGYVDILVRMWTWRHLISACVRVSPKTGLFPSAKISLGKDRCLHSNSSFEWSIRIWIRYNNVNVLVTGWMLWTSRGTSWAAVPLSTSSLACLPLSQNLILADAKTLFLMKVSCHGYCNKRIVSIVCIFRTHTKYTSINSLNLRGLCIQMFSSYVEVVPDSKSSISVTQQFSPPMQCSA